MRRTTSDRKPFCIVIPPPNVTGMLHMGHALNNTLQDIMTRFRRMQGYNALWMPGMDHAGIATQNVVEQELAREGKTRHDLGREKFIERVWKWKEKYGGVIMNQLKRLGCSCDWERERFTMDEGLSRAVREVFVRLCHDGLIYQGDYIVNWCPRCHTAISDLEVEFEQEKSNLWHIRYPYADGKGEIIVATTRPETMLGDTAVAVNPNDPRYKDVIGKMVILPLVNKEIPIIADDYVTMDFGSGAVKITPACDPTDFAMAGRHNLEIIKIMDDSAVINENGGIYKGQDRYEAGRTSSATSRRAAISSDRGLQPQHRPLLPLQDRHRARRLGAVVRQDRAPGQDGHRRRRQGRHEAHPLHVGGHLFRVDEQHPRLVHLAADLVGPPDPRLDLRGVRRGDRADRRPGRSAPTCKGKQLKQEEDVLDTWFSSALWPFSTLGWPDDKPAAQDLLPHEPSGHRVRHPLLLGGPHDDDGPLHHEGRALQACLPARPGPGRARRQDEQVQGQHHRPPGDDRQVRDRRLPLHAGGLHRPGPGHPHVRGADRGLQALRQQDLECHPTVHDEPRGLPRRSRHR